MKEPEIEMTPDDWVLYSDAPSWALRDIVAGLCEPTEGLDENCHRRYAAILLQERGA